MRSFAGKPWFIFLLPVFFFLHAYRVNFAPGVWGAALLETGRYLVIAGIACFLFYKLFRNIHKAALAGFAILGFHFFFGSGHDWLRSVLPPGSLLLRYTFIIPVFLLLLTSLIIYLKRSRLSFIRAVQFLNLLFILFVAIEIGGLLPLLLKGGTRVSTDLSGSFLRCDTCARPDVYVIIADEYAGREELEAVFSYDNSVFENDLRSRGFRVIPHTRSNYNFTAYAMAALFSMEYVSRSSKELVTQRDLLLCRSIIGHNNTGVFFKQRGYTIFNHSFFEFEGQSRAVTNYYFYPKRHILTAETFTSRFRKDLGYHFLSKSRREEAERNEVYRFNDLRVDSLAWQTASLRTGGPKLVYIHYNRPHHPYYYDETGLASTEPQRLHPNDKERYISYLKYSNRKLLELVDHIKSQASHPPVILLASDHGFRQFAREPDPRYYFMNLCAVHLPNRQYEQFYDGMSFVNTFRALLNAQFGQRLPLLKDTSVFLRETSN